MIDLFVQDLLSGQMGKVYSSRTAKEYKRYLERHPNIFNIDAQSIKNHLLDRYPPEMIKSRIMALKAFKLYSHWLHTKNRLSLAELQLIRGVNYKNHKPKRSERITETDYNRILRFCRQNNKLKWMMSFMLMAELGLRVSELCSLTYSDIDLNNRELTIIGKGQKKRILGIPSKLMNLMVRYRAQVKSECLHNFLQGGQGKLTPRTIQKWCQTVSKNIGVCVYPHLFRKYFVTYNHSVRGVPLKKLQVACGHSSITVTMGYEQTNERDVINDMKSW